MVCLFLWSANYLIIVSLVGVHCSWLVGEFHKTISKLRGIKIEVLHENKGFSRELGISSKFS